MVGLSLTVDSLGGLQVDCGNLLISVRMRATLPHT
jgi:hypothetical protein